MIPYQTQLNNIIANSVEQIKAISQADFDYKPKPAKWSKKEILEY